MKTSVIVPTFNRSSMLERCIVALYAQAGLDDEYEVIVVDDASTDDTESCIKRLQIQFPDLIYIKNSNNSGRSITRNVGITRSSGDIVVFVDDDIVVSIDYLASHIKCHKKHLPNHVTVLGNIRYDECSIAKSNIGRYLQSRYLGNRSSGDCTDLDLDNLPPKYFGSGIASVRRDDLLNAGLFNEAFCLYGGEDEYLGYKLWKSDIRIVFAEEARSIHHDKLTLSGFARKMREFGKSSYPLLLEKCPEYIENNWPVMLQRITKIIAVQKQQAGAKRKSHYSVSARLCSSIFCAVVNSPLIRILELWASRTDNISFLYSPALYRVLNAAWFLQGYCRHAE